MTACVGAYTPLGFRRYSFFYAVFTNLEMPAGSLLAGEGVLIGRSLCNIPNCAPRSRYTLHGRG